MDRWKLHSRGKMMLSPKRNSWFFKEVSAAEKFAECKRQDGSKDVVVVPVLAAEDKARQSPVPARVWGAKVIWTEMSTD
jgi:hypothetical protein